MVMLINWKTTKEEDILIRKIVDRATGLYPTLDTMTLDMDITACHLNGNPLRLRELLDADDFNFCHDVIGIVNNINRTNGKLNNCFLPRFSV